MRGSRNILGGRLKTESPRDLCFYTQSSRKERNIREHQRQRCLWTAGNHQSARALCKNLLESQSHLTLAATLAVSSLSKETKPERLRTSLQQGRLHHALPSIRAQPSQERERLTTEKLPPVGSPWDTCRWSCCFSFASVPIRVPP